MLLITHLSSRRSNTTNDLLQQYNPHVPSGITANFLQNCVPKLGTNRKYTTIND